MRITRALDRRHRPCSCRLLLTERQCRPYAATPATKQSTVAFVQGIVNDADMEESDKCEALHGFLVDALVCHW